MALSLRYSSQSVFHDAANFAEWYFVLLLISLGLGRVGFYFKPLQKSKAAVVCVCVYSLTAQWWSYKNIWDSSLPQIMFDSINNEWCSKLSHQVLVTFIPKSTYTWFSTVNAATYENYKVTEIRTRMPYLFKVLAINIPLLLCYTSNSQTYFSQNPLYIIKLE